MQLMSKTKGLYPPKKNKNREKMYNRNEKFQIKIAFKFVD